MANGAKPENWTRLVALMPSRVSGGFDALTHKTVADLVWLAQHEIDMHEEGEHPMTKAELRHVTDYLRMLRGIR